MSYCPTRGVINQERGRLFFSKRFIVERLKCSSTNSYANHIFHPYMIFNMTSYMFCQFSHQLGYQQMLAIARSDETTAVPYSKLTLVDTSNQFSHSAQVRNKRIHDMIWTDGQMRILIGCSTERTLEQPKIVYNANLIDVENGSMRIMRTFEQTREIIQCMALRNEHTFAYGGKCGLLTLEDMRTERAPFIQGIGKTVNGLAFQDEHTMLLCDSIDQSIKMWDLRQSSAPKQVIYKGTMRSLTGYSSLLIDKSRLKLYTSCIDNNIYSFDLSIPPNPIIYYSGDGNKRAIYDSRLSLSTDGEYLLSGSTDCNAYIWEIDHIQPFVKLEGHRHGVIDSSWCQNDFNNKVVTCDRDMRHKLWDSFHAGDDVIYTETAQTIPLDQRRTDNDSNWIKRCINGMRKN